MISTILENSKAGNKITKLINVSEDWSGSQCRLYALAVSAFYLVFFIITTTVFHIVYFSSPPISESVVSVWQKIIIISYFVVGGILVSGITKVSDKYMGQMALIYVVTAAIAGSSAIYYANSFIDTGI